MNFNKAEFITSYGKYSQIPASERPEFAFAGRSNVGKSSLINKVLNRKSLARVSGVPGKTATINFYGLENIHLVDLPGYGYAKIAKSEKERWAELIEGYLTADRDLALVFQLLDFRHPPSKDDVMMLDFLVDSELPFVIILTKADKLSRRQRDERLADLKSTLSYMEQVQLVEFSAVTGEGVEKIRSIIEEISTDPDME